MSEINKVELQDEELNKVAGGGMDGYEDEQKGMVKIVNCEGDVANLRDAAGGGQVIGRARYGHTYPYYGKYNGWYRISVHGQMGYVYKDYVKVL